MILGIQTLAAVATFGVEATNALAITAIREHFPQQEAVKNMHGLSVTVTNQSSHLVKEEGQSRYVVVMMRFQGEFIDEILTSTVSHTTNRPHFATSGGYVRDIPPNSSFIEPVYLEQELKLGRRIPSGDYLVLLVRKCGPMWDQVTTAAPIRIKIE